MNENNNDFQENVNNDQDNTQKTQEHFEPKKAEIIIDTKTERNWAMFCHLSALSCFLGVPFGNVLGPLILWLVKKDELPVVDVEGKEALNFQLSMTIYTMVAFMLCFVFIGFLLIFPIIIANLVLVIVAAIKASNGDIYQYPLTIRFIK
ncbi:MAG: DUF4870 domain-containing protein [Candidatus Omnitrophica bacterium]|nr:DUF4870 domain-containing protein [Candidatus Omnitrophota bacterium]MBU1996394.1 DUF4870 domain-containing protein [Candidatus Omnitrophota bacterium]MBU4333062.1 DUF4870 domain-containing protein [Candidatus Omnitrophota bacterium]